MTFHDEVYRATDIGAYEACKTLSWLLATIVVAPTSTDRQLRSAILLFAEDMGWEVVEDEYVGKVLR